MATRDRLWPRKSDRPLAKPCRASTTGPVGIRPPRHGWRHPASPRNPMPCIAQRLSVVQFAYSSPIKTPRSSRISRYLPRGRVAPQTTQFEKDKSPATSLAIVDTSRFRPIKCAVFHLPTRSIGKHSKNRINAAVARRACTRLSPRVALLVRQFAVAGKVRHDPTYPMGFACRSPWIVVDMARHTSCSSAHHNPIHGRRISCMKRLRRPTH